MVMYPNDISLLLGARNFTIAFWANNHNEASLARFPAAQCICRGLTPFRHHVSLTRHSVACGTEGNFLVSQSDVIILTAHGTSYHFCKRVCPRCANLIFPQCQDSGPGQRLVKAGVWDGWGTNMLRTLTRTRT